VSWFSLVAAYIAGVLPLELREREGGREKESEGEERGGERAGAGRE